MAGFRITGGCGFHITFENGYTVSVQFGGGNYCDNHDLGGEEWRKAGEKGCVNAECAVWPGEGDLLQLKGWSDTIIGWQEPEDVLKLLKWAARQSPMKPTHRDNVF